MWCGLARWIEAMASDSPGRPGRLARRHVAGCPSCRRYFDGQHLLDRELRLARPQSAQATVPADLLDNVLSAVARARGPMQQQRRVRRAWAFTLAASGTLAAAGVLLLAFYWPNDPAAAPPPRSQPQPPVAVDLPLSIASPQTLATNSSQALEDLAHGLVQGEVDGLVHTTTAAGQQLIATLPLGLGQPPRDRSPNPPRKSDHE